LRKAKLSRAVVGNHCPQCKHLHWQGAELLVNISATTYLFFILTSIPIYANTYNTYIDLLLCLKELSTGAKGAWQDRTAPMGGSCTSWPLVQDINIQEREQGRIVVGD